MKIKPMPVEAADRLLNHVTTCPQCKRALGHRRRGKMCPNGRYLVRQTLAERHPE